MPTRYTGRLLLILATIWIGFSAIYPQSPVSAFFLLKFGKGGMSWRHDLKPGIDINGGTSLIYEIQRPAGGEVVPDLADRMASALKTRVDPKGVRNLIWRPLGGDKLEIQLPRTASSGQSAAARTAFLAAQTSLDDYNLQVPQVIDALESSQKDANGADVRQKIDAYAKGSAQRTQLLTEIAGLTKKIAAAKATGDYKAGAEAEIALDPVKAQLEQTNVTPAELQNALDAQESGNAKPVEALRDRLKGDPQRLKAVDEFLSRDKAMKQLGDTVDDAASLKRLLKGSGVLSYHILVSPRDPQEAGVYSEAAQRLQERGPRAEPGEQAQWFEVSRPSDFGQAMQSYNGTSYALAWVDTQHSMVNREGLPQWRLDEVSRGSQNGESVVNFKFDPQGSKLFGELTGRWKPAGDRQYQLAIILDNRLISAPNINSQIFGSGIITGGRGGFSRAELDYLVNTLSAGSLPAQLSDEPISEITVGPQLGADNLRAGFIACGLGLVVVAIFLISYYYLSGLVAFIAVCINLLLILGCMALLNATFTLPGVAGVVLSVAMAVDANVLIFERLREEQARGLSLRMALGRSYDRAWGAILDGNVTTAISSIFLFWFGSEEVKGFGITLLLGIVTSLFTALFVTKTIFGLMVDKFGVTDLSSLPRTFPRWNDLLTPKIDWVGKTWLFTGFSALFIVGGLACMGVKLAQGDALDIEFSGGTSVRVDLVAPMGREQVQTLVDQEAQTAGEKLAVPRVVSVGTDDKQYEISTPTADSKAVQAAVIEALGDKLDIARPSSFAMVNQPFASAEGSLVFPIETAQDTPVPGVAPQRIADNVGGIVMVLKNVSPKLSAEQIRDRIAQRMLDEAPADRIARLQVDPANGGQDAIIYFSDPGHVYDASRPEALADWRNFATSAWRLVNDAVNNPPQLRSVTSFAAQVASDAKVNTIIALTASVLGIMAYVWLRFGNLKFGTATVVACVHDALFVLAAVGFSYYLGNVGFFDNVLLIKPFRIDLTLIAAVLTVIGYSMNDTVVVFDRIRENRGKYGILSRQVINDSVNQTMSRTLLTGGTSIGILAIMYFTGGEGIHGFTFVMLLGIVAGTYSSVAIAAPFLLLGKQQPAQTRPTARVALQKVPG